MNFISYFIQSKQLWDQIANIRFSKWTIQTQAIGWNMLARLVTSKSVKTWQLWYGLSSWACMHPLIHSEHLTTLLLFKSKTILVRQQNIYYIFSHASRLPCLDVCLKPSSPSPQKHSIHLTNFSPAICFHTENRNVFEDYIVFCQKLIIFSVKHSLELQPRSKKFKQG